MPHITIKKSMPKHAILRIQPLMQIITDFLQYEDKLTVYEYFKSKEPVRPELKIADATLSFRRHPDTHIENVEYIYITEVVNVDHFNVFTRFLARNKAKIFLGQCKTCGKWFRVENWNHYFDTKQHSGPGSGAFYMGTEIITLPRECNHEELPKDPEARALNFTAILITDMEFLKYNLWQ